MPPKIPYLYQAVGASSPLAHLLSNLPPFPCKLSRRDTPLVQQIQLRKRGIFCLGNPEVSPYKTESSGAGPEESCLRTRENRQWLFTQSGWVGRGLRTPNSMQYYSACTA